MPPNAGVPFLSTCQTADRIPAALTRPGDASFSRPSRERGRRECRVHAAPTALRAKQKDARRPTQVRRNHSGTPCAMVLRLLRALLGVPGFLATIACGTISANLTPASGS